jgi:hypothetical protein
MEKHLCQEWDLIPSHNVYVFMAQWDFLDVIKL